MLKIGNSAEYIENLEVLETPQGIPSKDIWRDENLICVQGDANYHMLHEKGWHIPTPNCDTISILGHLVSDGRGRLGTREYMLRDVVRRVKLYNVWHSVTSSAVALNITLAASYGRIDAACFEWPEATGQYHFERFRRLTDSLAESDIKDGDIIFMSPWFTTIEKLREEECSPSQLTDLGLRLTHTFFEFPGVSWFATSSTFVKNLVPVTRSLAVSGCVETRKHPTLFTLPCGTRAEDSEVRLKWSDWIRHGWKRAKEAAQTHKVLIRARKSNDTVYDEELMVIDISRPPGEPGELNQAIELICNDMCDVHLSKYTTPMERSKLFDVYYGSFGITPVEPVGTCLHPSCTRDGKLSQFASARKRSSFWFW